MVFICVNYKKPRKRLLLEGNAMYDKIKEAREMVAYHSDEWDGEEYFYWLGKLCEAQQETREAQK